jgi:hypothetical protein
MIPTWRGTGRVRAGDRSADFHIGNLAERLEQLETALVEAAGENPLADIVQRIDALETRVARVERRGFKFPVELHVNKAARKASVSLRLPSKADFNQLSAQGDRYVHLNNEVDEHRHQITALDNRARGLWIWRWPEGGYGPPPGYEARMERECAMAPYRLYRSLAEVAAMHARCGE